MRVRHVNRGAFVAHSMIRMPAARHGPRSAGCVRPAGRRCDRCRALSESARSRRRRLRYRRSDLRASAVSFIAFSSASGTAFACFCSTRCRIFPVAVRGISPVAEATPIAAACIRRCGSCTSRGFRPRSASPACGMITACTRSPHFASGTPITATSFTFDARPAAIPLRTDRCSRRRK